MSHFAQVAAQVQTALKTRLGAAVDMDAEKQRVNSYIADVLKDAHVLYAKLARLQGDFKGQEAEDLFSINEKVLTLGDDLSHFAKAFREGEAKMAETSFAYGDEGGAPKPSPAPAPEGGEAPPPAPEEGGEGEGVPFGEAPEEEEEEAPSFDGDDEDEDEGKKKAPPADDEQG